MKHVSPREIARACTAQGNHLIFSKLTKIENVRASARGALSGLARRITWKRYDYWPEKINKGTYVRPIIGYRDRT
jgi:hypothetical protein